MEIEAFIKDGFKKYKDWTGQVGVKKILLKTKNCTVSHDVYDWVDFEEGEEPYISHVICIQFKYCRIIQKDLTIMPSRFSYTHQDDIENDIMNVFKERGVYSDSPEPSYISFFVKDSNPAIGELIDCVKKAVLSYEQIFLLERRL